jgi:hypothetical protein
MAQIDWHKVDIWKPYRREDLGFEVELPGEPKIEEEQNEESKSIYAEVSFVGMMFGVDHVTFRRDVTITEVARQQLEAAKSLKSRIAREAPFTLGGYPAIEIVRDIEGAFVSIMRVVAIGNRAIAFNVLGGPDIAADPRHSVS